MDSYALDKKCHSGRKTKKECLLKIENCDKSHFKTFYLVLPIWSSNVMEKVYDFINTVKFRFNKGAKKFSFSVS